MNIETVLPDGTVRPEGGVLGAFEPPTGPGVRVDTLAYGGYRTSPSYDSLLAKVIVHVPSRRPRRAAGGRPGPRRVPHRRRRDEHPVAAATPEPPRRRRRPDHDQLRRGPPAELAVGGTDESGGASRAPLAGARRPVTIRSLSSSTASRRRRRRRPGSRRRRAADGTVAVRAPLQGTIVERRGRRGRRRPRRAAAPRHGSHEDGARRSRPTSAASCIARWSPRRHGVRGAPARVPRRGATWRRAVTTPRRARPRRASAPTWPRCTSATPSRLDARPARCGRPAPRAPASARHGRTSTTCATRARSWSTARW